MLWLKVHVFQIYASHYPNMNLGGNSSRFFSGLSATHTFKWELPGQKCLTGTNFMCFASLLSGNRTAVGMVIFLFPWKPWEKAYKPASTQSWSEFHWESPFAFTHKTEWRGFAGAGVREQLLQLSCNIYRFCQLSVESARKWHKKNSITSSSMCAGIIDHPLERTAPLNYW